MTTNFDIARDLKVFADPATEYYVQDTQTGTRIQLVRDGEQRDYFLDGTDQSIISRHSGGRRFLTAAALLASDEFADVRNFKATQRRILAAKLPKAYIEPEGELATTSGVARLRLDSFRATVAPSHSEALSILLIDGPAGIGKTSLIEQVVFERSDPASLLPPLLHVVSSGSRLTDLVKALAHATQVLRAKVTFDQVPILARYGVLQVAIDGFDELVDPEGYKDAWAALREFLREVRCGGPVVLAGRDTFFDQQRFASQLLDRIPTLDLRHARLAPVSPDTAKNYLIASGWSVQDVQEADRAGWFKSGSYRLRPFFLTQIAQPGGWEELDKAFGSPQAFLVNTFIDREATLISKMVGLEKERTIAALWQFYAMVVEDMANQESDTVDESFLGLACEAAFENLVPADDLAKLVQKAGSIGLLEGAPGGGVRRFPHSELQYQFLARVVVERLNSSAAVGQFVRRGVLPIGLLEAFSDAFDWLQANDALSTRMRLERMLQDDPFADRLVANVAALLLATLGRAGMPQLELSGISANEVKMIGTLESASLRDVTISHLDVRGANCDSVIFKDCAATVLTVDGQTQFGETVPEVTSSLQIDSGGKLEIVRTPPEIGQWLARHSATSASASKDDELPLMRYFDKLCRKFLRQHQIRNNDSDEAFFLLKHPYWHEVRAILGGRIEEVRSKSAQGPSDAFFRMRAPEQLLSSMPVEAEARLLRERMRDRARQIG